MFYQIQTFLLSTFKNDIPFNTLINLQKEIDIYSTVSINDKIIDEKNISEEISSHKNQQK